MRLEFVFKGLPPSTNNLFLTIGKRRVKTKEYREYEAYIHICLAIRGDKAIFKDAGNSPYRMIIELSAPDWICANGNVRRKDIGNLEKSLSDCIASFYGWRDENCFELIIRKVDGAVSMTKAIFEFPSRDALHPLRS